MGHRSIVHCLQSQQGHQWRAGKTLHVRQGCGAAGTPAWHSLALQHSARMLETQVIPGGGAGLPTGLAHPCLATLCQDAWALQVGGSLQQVLDRALCDLQGRQEASMSRAAPAARGKQLHELSTGASCSKQTATEHVSGMLSPPAGHRLHAGTPALVLQ